MAFFSKYKQFNETEKKLIDLLLYGHTDFIKNLKKQLEPPFFLGITRDRTPNEYKLSIIFDGNLENVFSTGKKIDMEIDDLVIMDPRISEPIRIKAYICEGILSGVIAYVKKPVNWPRYLKLKDWGYIENNNVSFEKKRRINFDLKVSKPYKEFDLSKCQCEWLKELINSSLDKGSGFIPAEKASLQQIKELELNIGAQIPYDFKEFLLCTNGANFWGTEIYRIEELYLLDEGDFKEKLLVFSIAIDGSVFVLVLQEINDSSKYCPVDFFDHDSGKRIRIGESFKESLKFIRDEIFLS